MDHKTCRENISAFLDGELPEDECSALENHLAVCPECRAELKQLGRLSAVIKQHAMEPVPLSLKGQVLGRRGKQAAYPWLRPVLALSAAAAGVLVVLNLGKNPEQTAQLRQESFSAAMPMHKTEKTSPPRTAEEPAAPAGRLYGELENKAQAPATIAAARGSYGQAKFSRNTGSISAAAAGSGSGAGLSSLAGAKEKSAGSAEALYARAAKKRAAAEFRGPVCLRVYKPASLNESDSNMHKALLELRKKGTRIVAAVPGNLVFVKNDGSRITLTEKDCSYGFIFFDGKQDPLVVTDLAGINDKYNAYFQSPSRP